MKTRMLIMSLFVVAVLFVGSAYSDTVTIGASKDNTLYEDPSGNLSNGAGIHFFSGRTGQVSNNLRRALVAFDIAANVSGGATINAVTLTLNMSKTVSGAQTTELRKVSSDWGEGTSDAPLEEGGGVASATGDATWLHTSFNTTTWTTVGGDFAGTASCLSECGWSRLLFLDFSRNGC